MGEQGSCTLPGRRGVAPRRLFGLAVPALGVLAAEPLYLLVDTAVVGHLGGTPLAALAVGGVVLAQLSTQLTFLAYGTTARAARQHGAGQRAGAVAEGVAATWLALAVGLVLVGVGQLFAGPVVRLLAGPGQVADAAVGWLRIALLGVPLILVTMAGNGWMRGVQETARPLRYVLAGNGISAVLCPLLVHVAGMGLTGSAVANVVAQAISAALFLRALAVERVLLRPEPARLRAQLTAGRDLVLRSLAFQACFVSAIAVAARTSAAAVGAHQVVLQLWVFLSLVLDSLAIAAQALVGAALGGRDETSARALARQVTGYGLIFGLLLAAVFCVLYPVLPKVFTSDAAVLGEIPNAWWFFVALQPVAGVVFALDGVLLGAGDAAFLRTATLTAALLGFLPMAWLSLALDWGLMGIWTGLTAFMLIRLATVLGRLRSGRWAVPGMISP
ncbi:DNA-damage-inducible protein F [Mycobacterium haemophilum DSM 44634]|uniref:MATE family efflux transporter n=1 Tax=Mycobacterium haemophilum TaxID=29311 RepID=UPI00065508F5|nr:MATE family efflux transporter [Mycobacterium haemophilum]AKN16430.1 MATE family efflux transporter [Mycobacterium haemophilum DSM 44634]MCV7341450.1 MATE family efflux transporter [Mycobacterium haemophilum DSM 44634]